MARIGKKFVHKSFSKDNLNPEKSLRIRMLSGDPSGVLEIKIANRPGKIIIVPRGNLQSLISMEGAVSRAVYFLFGGNDFEKPFVYIGQTDNFQRRLTQHDIVRNDWNIAFGFLPDDNDIDIRYLEGKCTRLAYDAGRYEVKNKQNPPNINLDSFGKPINDEFLENINIIVNLFRYPLFQKPPKKEDAKDVYYFRNKDANASGVLLENNKFMVYKGSTACVKEVQSFFASGKNLRRTLIDKKVLVKNEDIYFFACDYIFNSPSSASGTVAGKNSNGWSNWKNKEGKTLDESKREE